MGTLGRHCVRAAAIALALILLAAFGAGMVRLLPWLLSAEVPLAVTIPFAKALSSVAVETALLAGLPAGFALGAAVFVERGEARALMALGASPLRLIVGCLPHVVLLASATFGALALCDVDASSPGRMAASLIKQGKSSCRDATSPRSALVPMVGVTWLCFPGQPPRVTGKLPAIGNRAWFTAAELQPSPDLRTFELEDLRLVTRPEGGSPQLRLHTGRAHVAGLSPWGRSAKLPTQARAALVASVAALLSLLVAWLMTVGGVASRAGAVVIGGVPAVVAIHLLHRVDGGPSGMSAYLWVPCGAAAAAWASAAVWIAISRLRVVRGLRVARREVW